MNASCRIFNSSGLDILGELVIISHMSRMGRPLVVMACSWPHRMERLCKEEVPKKKVLNTQADALKSYIYARRHFGSGGNHAVIVLNE